MDYKSVEVARHLKQSALFVLPELEVMERTYDPDERLLKRLLAHMWDAPTLHELKYFIFDDKLEAWKTPTGLILLECVDWSQGRELHIYGMVGRDILTPGRVEPIVRDLKVLASFKQCSMIGGEGVPKGWQRAAPALGFKPVSTHYVMEL